MVRLFSYGVALARNMPHKLSANQPNEVESLAREHFGGEGATIAVAIAKWATSKLAIHICLIAFALMTTSTRANELDLVDKAAPVVREFCFDCHNNDTSSGELNLESMLDDSPIVRNRGQWINVIVRAVR